MLRRSRIRALSTEDLCSLANDAIMNFPAEINTVRDNDMYGVVEAYSILRGLELCGEHDFKFEIVSSSKKCVNIAKNEVRMALSDCQLTGKAFCGIYTVPPYTVLICSVCEGMLYVVDSHAVSDELKGDCKNGCLLYTSPSPRDRTRSRMPSSA